MTRYTEKNRVSHFWSRALALGTVLFPWSLAHVDFRSSFTGHLAVSAVRSSPAYAAFEDTIENYSDPGEFQKMAEPAQTLASGTSWGSRAIEPMQHRVALNGLTVRAPEVVAAPLPPVAAKPVVVAQGRVDKQSLYIDESQEAFTSTPRGLSAPVPTLQLASNALSKAADRAVWLRGQVEMTGGLGYVPDTQLVVKRVAGGKTLEKGKIWIQEGRFEIQVDRPTGYLVAELRRPDGHLMGRGEIDLLNLNAEAAHGAIDNLRLAMQPSKEVNDLRVVSAYSHDDSVIPIDDGRLEFEGAPGRPALAHASSFVARATAKKSWPTLVVGQSEIAQDVRLYSDALIESLIEIGSRGTDRAEAQAHGIVWGQVTKNGAQVEGARVEMAEGGFPIYFDAGLHASPGLTATSKNGLFAFVNVKPGTQAVRVAHGGRTYPAQVFPAEERHVSYVDFVLRDKVSSQFKILDALEPKRKVSASLKLVGNDTSVTIGNEARVDFAVAGHTFMVEADAGPDFEVSRTTVSGAPHQIYVPLVKREWLRRLSEERAVVTLPGQGVVAGFVDDRDFAVEFAGLNQPAAKTGVPAPQVVYVDANGKALPGHQGVAGGGFVIFNAPTTLQTVYIHPAHARESFSQVVVPESGLVHVMSYSAESGQP